MIPIKLTLEGLYSYQEKQIIDFTNLIEAGLFGIFGKVGSGKSSILEAISFGLYGETERMNKADKRAYNMMNLKSNRSVIDFEFFNFQNEKYRIYREFKRNSKRFDDVKRGETTCYKFEDGIWVPQSEVNIEKVIGLSYDNFKRTIIIPQGKFREFIELKGTERTKMMQEIFGLDKFDLAAKAKGIYGQAKESLNLIEGQLKTFIHVTPVLIEERKIIHKQEAGKLEKLTQEFKIETEVFQKLKTVKDDFEQLIQKNAELSILNEQLPVTLKLKEDLGQYERISKAFSTLLLEQTDITLKRTQKEKNLTLLAVKVDELQKTVQQVQLDLTSVTALFEGIEFLKAERYELDLIKQIKEAQTNKDALVARYAKGHEFVGNAEEKVLASQQMLVEKENELLLTKEKRIDTNMIVAMGEWFAQNSFYTQALLDADKKIKNLSKDIHQQDEDIQKLKLKNTQNWEEEIEGYRVKIETKLEKAEHELRHLNVSHKLSEFANTLHAGTACPLCGSHEHPHILQVEDLSLAIQANEVRCAEFKDQQKRLVQYERKARTLFDKRHLLLVQYQENVLKQQDLQKQVANHLQQFVWTIIPQGDEKQFVQLKEQANDINQQIDVLSNAHSTVLKERDIHRVSLEKFKAELANIEVEKTKIESEIESKSQQIVRLQLDTYLQMDKTLLEENCRQKENTIDTIEKRYKQLTAEFQELTPRLAGFETEKTALIAEINDFKLRQEQLTLELNDLLRSHEIKSLEEVNVILDKQLEVENLREKIQAFEIKYQVVQSEVQVLTKKLGELTFDENQYTQQHVILAQLELQVKELTGFVGKLVGEIERLEKDYTDKQVLHVEHEKLDKRVRNLNVLLNMFSGAGFVNYVSTIYLRNLCDMANVRFHRLTNNQLSLQLNDNNEFEIIDYLNNGKSRSVKTLSGGQSFQVSLSLALALAESVQSLSKSDKNFFFIDEGFGTQDSESVNIVFETLSNLHKENRIVGIISHVDELQEKIPMSLSVTKDEDRGSLITVN